MTLLMSATANTILTAVIVFPIGFLAGAFWYGSKKEDQKEERSFDERDIYSSSTHVDSKGFLKKVK